VSQALFSFFACLTGAAALGVILSRNAVNAAMCLLLCLAGVAGLFVRLDAFLLAFLLLLVYAGAVIALFLFIIMLLDVRGTSRPSGRGLKTAAGVIAGLVLFAALAGFISRLGGGARSAGPAPVGAALKLYADQLFTVYLLPVQVIGFLLLIAMLGAIALSRRVPPGP
jgi:NADH-quinone oxidoreductase subunit J